MLIPEPSRYAISEFDRTAFERFVPKDHPLVAAERKIDWETFRPMLAAFYSADTGQPAIDPVRILKLEFLRYRDGLSDRQVIARAESDLSYRYFLQVGFLFRMPDPSVLCRFRGRLGEAGFEQVFNQVVAQARKAGLVKDRLRLKDASHVIASVAIPTTLTLVAQIRDQVLAAAAALDAEGAAGHQLEAELVRERTKHDRDEVRLAARVAHLRDVVEWARSLEESQEAEDANRKLPEVESHKAARKKLLALRELAEKVLHDREHPEAGRKTLSVADPDARRGKHGKWYEGYLTDILLDPDSGIITQVQVLEAGGDEAKDAVELIRKEEAAHGNDIQNLSIDGAGFNGEMIRALEGDDGLRVTTYVPPKVEDASVLFTARDFVLNATGHAVTCPAGNTSTSRERKASDAGTRFRFPRGMCQACPLVRQCLAKPETASMGRTVTKSDYEEEYQRIRQRATTAEFRDIRREHPAVERKLNEILNHHGGRNARYRGRVKVQIQHYMTCMVVNVKRFLKLTSQLCMSSS